MMALPMNSLYSLTWGDYGTSLVSAIQLLRCHGDLVDCTLAAGGRSFPAHKIVLCAASPFLLDLLKNTPCKHPVVMLAGVNANDLEALLEFVYRGEVSVDHAQLPSLLQAAQCLNIQGLAPQTVTKDDYTTHSIQLQHMIPQHHTDQDQLIATIATAPQQTVHAQVVEDLHPASGQILQQTTQTNATGQQTIVTTDTPKDVIQQFLPARKRKPRAKKISATASKIAKVEGVETILSTPTGPHQHHHHLQQGIENGGGGGGVGGPTDQIITSTPHIKSEVTKVEAIVGMDPLTPVTSNNTSGGDGGTGAGSGGGLGSGGGSGGTPTTTTTTKTKRSKNTNASGEKPRSRSQSEQPATCPICYAVIRQSRNLRRHLELRHFAKPGVKKEKKSSSGKKSGNASGGTGTSSSAAGGGGTAATITTSAVSSIPHVQSVQSLHTLQTVQVKKDPDGGQSQGQTITVTTASGAGSGGGGAGGGGASQQLQQHQQQVQQVTQVQQQQQQQQLQQQQQQHHQIIDQSGNITTTTTAGGGGGGNQGQQQSQGQIVTQTENTDGTTSLSIAQVQTLQGHQILGNIQQGNNKNILVKKVFILKGGNNT